MQSILSYFELILFILTLGTGIVWLLDIFYFAKQRRALADVALTEFDARNAKFASEGIKIQGDARVDIEERLLLQPMWIEYSGSFFPVIALVFFLRSFLYEPFQIPSSSMEPTLRIGDLILVNKFTYGVRLPILQKKIVDVNSPQRGDVMVFKYPKDTTVNYIKRVIGVPGDKIVYKNKHLTINDKEVSYQPLPDYLYQQKTQQRTTLMYLPQSEENLTGIRHKIVIKESAPSIDLGRVMDFPYKERCTYNYDGFACAVPAGNYFMMGDNRDDSEDGRYWGFVPEKNIVGKAFFIWMNLSNFPLNLKRIGGFQ